MIKRQDLVIKLNHLILIKGFQTQSMSTLAQQVGVSRATLYLNFKNRIDPRNLVKLFILIIRNNPGSLAKII